MECNTIWMYATERSILVVSKTLGFLTFIRDAPNLRTPFDEDRQWRGFLKLHWFRD